MECDQTPSIHARNIAMIFLRLWTTKDCPQRPYGHVGWPCSRVCASSSGQRNYLWSGHIDVYINMIPAQMSVVISSVTMP